MDVLNAIKGRRSIRQFKDIPVPDDVLNQVLEAARWAPSWANTQCIRYIVVKDAGTRATLASMVSKGNPAAEAMKMAPIVIVACAELQKSGFYKGVQSTDRGDWFMFDAGIAMQNMALAAHALGLGTVHVGYIVNYKGVHDLLGIPDGFAAVEMMPLGYPAGEGKATPRKDLSEIVFYEKYGKH